MSATPPPPSPSAPEAQPPYAAQGNFAAVRHPQGQPAPPVMIVRAHKEMGIAYILWLFLGTLGIHRFYLGRTGTGITQLVLSLVGWATALLLIGFVFLAVVWVWVIVDAFLIPGMTREANRGAA